MPQGGELLGRREVGAQRCGGECGDQSLLPIAAIVVCLPLLIAAIVACLPRR